MRRPILCHVKTLTVESEITCASKEKWHPVIFFRFDPDRFSSENIKELPSLAYQPFGFAGKRKCPGWRFSIAEGLVFLAVLIKRFKFHLVEGQQVKPVHGLVTSPAEEIWVIVTKR